MLSRWRNEEDGMTLVELMVVVLILGVVGGVTLTGLIQGMRTSDRVEARIQTFTDLQRASERVTRDLRRGVWTETSASPLPAVPAGCGFISLDDDDLTLIVFDGADRYRHRYFLAAGELRLDIDRWNAGAWQDERVDLVMTGLTNTAAEPVFSYLDARGDDLLADGLDATDRAAVRKFRLRLVGQVRSQADVELDTLVNARNGGLPCPVAS